MLFKVGKNPVEFKVLRFSQLKSLVEFYARFQWNLIAQICDKNNINGVERAQALQNAHIKFNSFGCLSQILDNPDIMEKAINMATDSPVDIDEIHPDTILAIIKFIFAMEEDERGN